MDLRSIRIFIRGDKETEGDSVMNEILGFVSSVLIIVGTLWLIWKSE